MKKLDGRTVTELILLVISMLSWVLHKAEVIRVPGLTALSLGVAMGMLGVGYVAQKVRSRKIAGVLILAFGLLNVIVGIMEIKLHLA